ncbi:MAG: prenyltransferase/squalene oxidase repeat-containing protein [Armatimonadota bacterium]
MIDRKRLHDAVKKARETLLDMRTPEGFWEGRLSSSALATATAVSAMAVAATGDDAAEIRQGCWWLADTQNPDGGWGDTPDSPSNLSTTLLVAAALKLADMETDEALDTAFSYLNERAGDDSASRARTIQSIYGTDRTFAVPILMNCALAGLVEWNDVPSLPYELAALPRGLFRFVGLQVVSYALPALIVVGMGIAGHNAPWCRCRLGGVVRGRLLGLLGKMQPESGGYLEAVPLSAFVAMSLVDAVGRQHPVVARCLEFLRDQMRPDGSWPIDVNLSVWVTTAATSALYASGGFADAAQTLEWIQRRQMETLHPFTGAAPGGWPWTHHSGGVPDADDTAGALLTLTHQSQTENVDDAAVSAGVRWLLRLQNDDGGWPTFCRGWGRLPFDRSCPDITAHAIRALRRSVTASLETQQAIERGLEYLLRTQRSDGSWVPLWFGNQGAANYENPVLGTARVLPAIATDEATEVREARRRAVDYLRSVQNTDGGWGGGAGVESSVEETALVVIGLAAAGGASGGAMAEGVEYLLQRIDDDTWTEPSPIGLYFASLWYHEDMYPVVWTVEALGRAAAAFEKNGMRDNSVVTRRTG